MTKSEIVRAIVLDCLNNEPDFMTFIESFPDGEFESYQDDDRVLKEIYQAVLEEIRSVKNDYGNNS